MTLHTGDWPLETQLISPDACKPQLDIMKLATLPTTLVQDLELCSGGFRGQQDIQKGAPLHLSTTYAAVLFHSFFVVKLYV